MRNELMIFKGYEVEVLEWNGELLFNPYHVGKCLEISPEGVRKAIARMNNKQFMKLKNSDVANCHFRKLNNAGENFLTESGVYKLVFKSHKPNAEEFTDWIADEVLPALRQTGSYEIPREEKKTENQVQFKEIVEVIPLIAQDLGVNNISRLVMYKELCKDYNVPTDFLPSYIDNGDREKKSATELLKQFRCGISARQFNILMLKAGYLEERERKSTSSKTGVKKFKALTEKGKKYGENQTAEQNAKETQPLYYVDTFQELFDLVMQEAA